MADDEAIGSDGAGELPKPAAASLNSVVCAGDAASPTMAAAAAAAEGDDDDDVCRICRLPGGSDNPLRYPCACRGSIKFVHDACLLRWLSCRRDRRCEVCKHEIIISHVYAANAPVRLPLSEFTLELLKKVLGWLFLSLFLVVALAVWGFVMPVMTTWIWRLALVRSFGEAWQLILGRLSFNSILDDGLYGCKFTTSVDVMFLWASLSRLFLRDLAHFRQQNGFIRVAANAVAPFAMWVARLEARLQHRFGRLDSLQVLALHVVKSALVVAVANVVFACCFAFLPFSVGRIILFCISCFSAGNMVEDGHSHISKAYILLVGYKAIFSLIVIYAGLLSFLQYMRGERLTIRMLFECLIVGWCWLFARVPFRRFHGVDVVVQGTSNLSRQLLMGIIHVMTFVKVALLMVIVFGIFPLLLGCWFDVCTSKLFGITIPQKLDSLFVSSFASASLHWLIGLVYIGLKSRFVHVLHEVLRKEVIHFLRKPGDQNFSLFSMLNDCPLHKIALQLLFSFSCHVLSVVMVVLLPVEMMTRVVPTFFPLDTTIFNPSAHPSQKCTDLLCAAILLKFLFCNAIKYLKPRTTMGKILQYWFVAVGWALGLMGFLLPKSEEADESETENAGSAKQLCGACPDYARCQAEDLYRRGYFFVFCIVLLLVLTWVAFLLFNSAIIVVPVLLGRALLGSIPQLPIAHGFQSNDLFAFAMGSCVIWGTIAGSSHSYNYMTTGRTHILLSNFCKWGTIALKSSPLLLIWIFIIPLLIGLHLNVLAIVPFRVPVNESPVFYLYYDWSLGLIFLKIWIKLAPLVDGSWHAKLTRAREDGFSRLRAMWVLREILVPTTAKLLIAFCVPYVLAKCTIPIFGYSLAVNSTVYRLVWLGRLLFRVLYFCVQMLNMALAGLHDSIRDDRYVIGQRLQNYSE